MEPWSKSSKEAHPGLSLKSRPPAGFSYTINNQKSHMQQEDDEPSIISISNFEQSNRNCHF